LISALQLLYVLKAENKPLSQLAAIMTVFPQVLKNVEVKEKPDLKTITEIARVIQDVEEKFADKGRVLVRYSGTQNLCRVMVEGPTPKETEQAAQRIADVVQKKLNE
jgi:phosphoglucosamine mutase